MPVYRLPGVFVQAVHAHKAIYLLSLCPLGKDRQISSCDLDCGFSLRLLILFDLSLNSLITVFSHILIMSM